MSLPNLRIKRPREHEIRKQKTCDMNPIMIEYPLYYVNESLQFTPNMIRRDILIEDMAERARHGNFPQNIHEYFWIKDGEIDGLSWLCLGKLTNGAYFFFSAYCDVAGFNCGGDMTLYVSNSFKNIIEYGMEDDEYRWYVQETDL